MWQWRTTDWRFQEWPKNSLGNNTIRCKKLATIVSSRKNVHCCYISALVLTCFRLMKGRATFFQPETIVASFLHLMVLLFKVLLNHSSKCHFLVRHCHFSTISEIQSFSSGRSWQMSISTFKKEPDTLGSLSH